MLQKHGARIGTQGDGFGCQQLLSHNRFGIAFHAVKIDPFVGGVFINEPYGALIVFGNDIGAQHLSGDAPGRFGRRFQLFLSSQRIGVRRVRVHSGREGGRGGAEMEAGGQSAAFSAAGWACGARGGIRAAVAGDGGTLLEVG